MAGIIAGGGGGAQALQIHAPVVQQTPKIDGTVTPAEQSAAGSATMTVVGGLDIPRHPTKAFVSLTPVGLYVAFICDDPAVDKLVVNSRQENGPVFQDDSVQLFIAPDREANNTNYFHFAVNPDGIKYSTSMAEEVPVEGWTAAAARGTNQWSAELLIPYAAIEAKVEAPYWRLNLARERPERTGELKETSAWINPGASLHNYKRFGFLQITGQIPTPQATPVVSAPVAPTPAAATAGPAIMTTTTAAAITSPPAAMLTPAPANAPTTGGVFLSGRQ